jgi:hypothetical protein
MIRFVFLLLVVANLVVWLIARGDLDPGAALRPATREPERMQQQLEADKLIPLNEEQYTRLANLSGNLSNGNREAQKDAIMEAAKSEAPKDGAAADAASNDKDAKASDKNTDKAAEKSDTPSDKVAEKPTAPIPACFELSNLDEANARKVSTQLNGLKLGTRLQTKKVEESTQWLVFIPPRPDKPSAEKKIAELKALGVSETYLINDNSSLRWAVSLGVFSSREAADVQLEKLKEKGVKTAKVGPRNPDAGSSTFTLRKLNASEWEKVQALLKPLKGINKREC